MIRMSKRKKNISRAAGLAVIVVVLGAGVILVTKGISAAKSDKSEEKVSVYMLKKDVAADDTVSADNLEMINIDRDMVPDNLLELTGSNMKYKIAFSSGTILTNNMVYEGDVLTDDLRIHNFPYIELTDKIEVGDYVDIRISFTNGYDYVLLSKKKVMDYSLYDEEAGTDNSLWMNVGEEEIMRLSGAVVDASLSEGSRIYAIKYVSESQDGAIVNYPVSAAIQALIENDPNIVDEAQRIVTENLRESLEQTLEKEDDEKNYDSLEADDENFDMDMYDDQVYEQPEDEELVFLD